MRFAGQPPVIYSDGELDQLVLGYATTIHKAQGSEFPAVIIPMVMDHGRMLQRRLLYTGVTRGKQGVILVGQPEAVTYAVRHQGDSCTRWTQLRGLLTPRASRL